MDGMQREELERLMFFEQTREKAAAGYARNPKDADNLTRWGGALLELAHFRQGQDSIDMVQDAVKKLEEALQIKPRKHDALWCLGNAHTSQGFLVTDTDKANSYFKKAARCFQQALDEEPNNELYLKALEMTEKAPSLHQELQKQLASQQVILGGGTPSPSAATSKVLSFILCPQGIPLAPQWSFTHTYTDKEVWAAFKCVMLESLKSLFVALCLSCFRCGPMCWSQEE
jgi:tetratricopeptide (TPR) repeat protein